MIMLESFLYVFGALLPYFVCGLICAILAVKIIFHEK